ncbi:MAG: ACT domain-containing protein [Candidatus Micrarchaeota archaeon]
MREITILSEDRVGLLADISVLLANNRINLKYISAHAIADKAAIHLVTSSDKRAVRVLENAGFNVLGSDTLVVKLRDRIGELAGVARKLADNNVNIEHAQWLTREGGKGGKTGKVLISLKVDKPKKAAKLLRKYL